MIRGIIRRLAENRITLIALLYLGVVILLAAGRSIIATDRMLVQRSDTGWLILSRPGGEAIASHGGVRAPIPYDPDHIDLRHRLEPPGRSHFLGTDDLGRDLASRMVHGAAVSLTIAGAATLSALLLGTFLGSLAGYWGGAVDWTVSRAIETVSCFPFLFLLLAIVSVATPSVGTTVLALTITGWTTEARFVRAEFLRLRTIDFAEAARASGARHWRIAFRHLLPHALTPVIVSASFGMGSAILLESAISFLGFGVSLPTPSWGGILAEAEAHLANAWWLALFPGVAIALTVLACNLIGERLRDVLDPRQIR